MSKSFYEILEIREEASQEEIKKAFKRLAAIHHPDADGGDESKFKEINEAYQTLSDDLKRAKYDLGRQFNRNFGSPGPRVAGSRPFIDDLFTNLWNFHPESADASRKSPSSAGPVPTQEPGDDITADLLLTLEESVKGCKKQIKISSPRPSVQCGVCGGGGSQPGTRRVACASCSGYGRHVGFSNPGVRICPACRGQGTVPLIPCQNCKGTGKTVYVKEIIVNIPPGISEGQQLRIACMGSPGHPPGDLYLSIRIKANNDFWRQGQDVHTRKQVDMKHAILGGPTRIEGPDGSVREVMIPPGTQPGDLVRVPGAGVANPVGGAYGDLIVHVVVQLPKTLSSRAAKLLEELSDELSKGAKPLT